MHLTIKNIFLSFNVLFNFIMYHFKNKTFSLKIYCYILISNYIIYYDVQKIYQINYIKI